MRQKRSLTMRAMDTRLATHRDAATPKPFVSPKWSDEHYGGTDQSVKAGGRRSGRVRPSECRFQGRRAVSPNSMMPLEVDHSAEHGVKRKTTIVTENHLLLPPSYFVSEKKFRGNPGQDRADGGPQGSVLDEENGTPSTKANLEW
jgi:hypothetical protein